MLDRIRHYAPLIAVAVSAMVIGIAIGSAPSDREQAAAEPASFICDGFCIDDRSDISIEGQYTIAMIGFADRLAAAVDGPPRVTRQLVRLRDQITGANNELDQWACATSPGGARLAAAATAAVNAAAARDAQAYSTVGTMIAAARRDLSTFRTCG